MKLTKCERCKGKFPFRKSKRFCSTLCQAREQAHKFYQKNKEKKWYKDRQRKSFKNWRILHREHFNDLVRNKNRLYQRKIRSTWKKLGLCPSCGGLRDSKWKSCSKCRRKKYGRRK